MNNIAKLINYIQKQTQKPLDYEETSATPTPSGGVMTPASKTSADLMPEKPKSLDGGDQVPAQDRLYLVDGIIPGSTKTPDDLKLKAYQGIEKEEAQFVDKRQIHRRHKGLFNEIHPDIHANKSFGGIVINQDGQVLLRKPKGTGFGNKWTLAKGGADEGESGSEAALREVLEETGITGKIVKELPGHYNADGKGNKFYLMEVDSSVEPQPFKGTDEGKEETDEIKWVDLAEAMELLEEKYEGKSEEKTDRDIQAIRQGHREWSGRHNRASFHKSIMEKAQKMSVDATEAHETLGDYFTEHGEFPADLREDPYYFSLLAEIGKETFTPKSSGSKTYTMLKGLMGTYFKKIDQARGLSGAATFSNLQNDFAHHENGWGGSALERSVHTNIVAHAVAEIRGFPESWMFGTSVPEDLDSSGRPLFRSDALRNEMIKAYDAFEAGKTQGTGFFSNGEKYNFNKTHPVTYKTLKNGKSVKETIENHWDLVIGRAKAVKSRKDAKSFHGKSWNTATKNTYLEYAQSYLKSQGKTDLYNDLVEKGAKGQAELVEYGKEFVREYAKTVQNITQGLLKAALPVGVNHVYTLRHVGSARELAGDYGIDGSTPAGAESLPKSSEDIAGGAGQKQIVHSGVLAGGSVNPKAWSNTYTIFRRTNIRDIFMIQALWNPGHEGERELIIVNNPHSEARIVRRAGELWNAKTWGVAPNKNGMFPEGVFDHKGKNWGITDSSTDFSTTLEPATSTDNPMVAEHKGGQLGTNPGKLMKDKTGKQFYIKYSSEDGKNASEDLANKLYEAAGIAVPHTEVVKWENGTVLKSDWIDDTVHHGTSDGTLTGTPSAELVNRPEIKHGFLVDCVLANYDVAGAGPEKPYGNLMEVDGQIIRIDQGGALTYKGLDGQKGGNGSPFWEGHSKLQTENGFLDEIDNLRNENVNATTSHIFQNMTEDDWDGASANLMKLTNSRIEDIVNDSAILATDKDKMIDTLKARRDAALKWWLSHPELVGQTGYSSIEDLHTKSNLLKQDIFKAVDEKLEAHKNQRSIWIDEEGYNERMMRTEEKQAVVEKDFEYTNELMKQFRAV